MSRLSELGGEVVRRLDDESLRVLFAGISVRAEAVQRRLARSNLAWVGREGVAPTPWELQRAAEAVVGWTRATASFVGGVAGLGGALGVPPEAALWIAAVVRMAQRIGVVYGFDPESERGRVALGRVLAEAFQVELPDQGPDRLRISDLLGALRPSSPGVSVPAVLARAVVVRAALQVVGRAARLVPVLSSGWSAVDGQQRTAEIGQAIVRAWQRLSDRALPGVVEDAMELVAVPDADNG